MKKIGRIPAWAAARLEPRAGATLPLDALFQDYAKWCLSKGRVPLRQGVFRDRFIAFAKDVGIPLHIDMVDTVVLDTTTT